MGRSKEVFYEMREEELVSDTRRDPIHELSDRFVGAVDKYDNGDISALDLAVKLKNEIESLEVQINYRKSWLDENKDTVESEAAQHNHEYGGYKITKTVRESLDFKEIAEWAQLEAAKKDFEARSKAALQMVRKGGLNVDENGAEIPLPKITTTSYLTFKKQK